MCRATLAILHLARFFTRIAVWLEAHNIRSWNNLGFEGAAVLHVKDAKHVKLALEDKIWHNSWTKWRSRYFQRLSTSLLASHVFSHFALCGLDFGELKLCHVFVLVTYWYWPCLWACTGQHHKRPGRSCAILLRLTKDSFPSMQANLPRSYCTDTASLFYLK